MNDLTPTPCSPQQMHRTVFGLNLFWWAFYSISFKQQNCFRGPFTLECSAVRSRSHAVSQIAFQSHCPCILLCGSADCVGTPQTQVSKRRAFAPTYTMRCAFQKVVHALLLVRCDFSPKLIRLRLLYTELHENHRKFHMQFLV